MTPRESGLEVCLQLTQSEHIPYHIVNGSYRLYFSNDG